MKIKEINSGVEFDAEIVPVSKDDFKIVKNDNKRFGKFDWSKYKGKEVYKLRQKNVKEILGLMCIIDHEDELTNAIEIGLLEVAAENVGSNKKVDNIGGCLIAFACRESLKREHDGFVFLVPKTDLIEHYRDHYGFEHVPLKTSARPEGIMVLYEQSSRALIEKYIT